jgi:hypothetical protein
MAVLSAVAVGTAAVATWRRMLRCESACAEAERQVEELVGDRRFTTALEVIDAIDRTCRCSRFTSGDAPSLYALADLCLRQVLTGEIAGEQRLIIAGARGSIIRGLLHDDPFYRETLRAFPRCRT